MYIYSTYVHLRWPNNLIGSTPTKTPNQLDEDVLVGFQAIENAHQTRLEGKLLRFFPIKLMPFLTGRSRGFTLFHPQEIVDSTFH